MNNDPSAVSQAEQYLAALQGSDSGPIVRGARRVAGSVRDSRPSTTGARYRHALLRGVLIAPLLLVPAVFAALVRAQVTPRSAETKRLADYRLGSAQRAAGEVDSLRGRATTGLKRAAIGFGVVLVAGALAAASLVAAPLVSSAVLTGLLIASGSVAAAGLGLQLGGTSLTVSSSNAASKQLRRADDAVRSRLLPGAGADLDNLATAQALSAAKKLLAVLDVAQLDEIDSGQASLQDVAREVTSSKPRTAQAATEVEAARPAAGIAIDRPAAELGDGAAPRPSTSRTANPTGSIVD